MTKGEMTIKNFLFKYLVLVRQLVRQKSTIKLYIKSSITLISLTYTKFKF